MAKASLTCPFKHRLLRKTSLSRPPDSYQPGLYTFTPDKILPAVTVLAKEVWFLKTKGASGCGTPSGALPKILLKTKLHHQLIDGQCRNKNSTSESRPLSLSTSPYSSAGFLFGFRDHVLKHHALHLSQRLSNCFRTIWVKLKIFHELPDFESLKEGSAIFPSRGSGTSKTVRPFGKEHERKHPYCSKELLVLLTMKSVDIFVRPRLTSLLHQ